MTPRLINYLFKTTIKQEEEIMSASPQPYKQAPNTTPTVSPTKTTHVLKTQAPVKPLSRIQTTIARQLLYSLANKNVLFVFPGHQTVSLQQLSVIQPEYVIQFHTRQAFWRLVRNPLLHFGDLYAQGEISVEGSLIGLLDVFYRAAHQFHLTPKGKLFHKLMTTFTRPKKNRITGSKNNIHHHYDIGNDFYRLWLDKDVMQYTCAYYAEPSMTLEAAQVQKLHHVCRKLNLKPGEQVLEAGSGWGGLSRFMAKHYGVKVTAYNISDEQIKFSRQQAIKENVGHLVTYVHDDYRNAMGDQYYDAFVSVGMLEHVGTDHYQELGDVIARCLKTEGRGLIHTIGRCQPKLMNPWIEKRIFPGAYPPSLKEMMDIFEPHHLAVTDVENLRQHYAKTLEHWLERYEQAIMDDKISFDDTFQRMWRLYLSGSIVAFYTGDLQLFQVVFNRARDRDIPWNRGYLYQPKS
jgi:cyclopropane-fatty-acyl-phospholipid synthase